MMVMNNKSDTFTNFNASGIASGKLKMKNSNVITVIAIKSNTHVTYS